MKQSLHFFHFFPKLFISSHLLTWLTNKNIFNTQESSILNIRFISNKVLVHIASETFFLLTKIFLFIAIYFPEKLFQVRFRYSEEQCIKNQLFGYQLHFLVDVFTKHFERKVIVKNPQAVPVEIGITTNRKPFVAKVTNLKF